MARMTTVRHNLWNFGLEQCCTNSGTARDTTTPGPLELFRLARSRRARARMANDSSRIAPCAACELRLAMSKITSGLRPLHRGVHNLADAPDVFVVDRVPLGSRTFWKIDLLRQLGSDASQNAFGRLGDCSSPPTPNQDRALRASSSVICRFGSSTAPRSCTTVFTAKAESLPVSLSNSAPQILLRLVVLAGGHDNGVFHRAHYNLRIQSLFPGSGRRSVVSSLAIKVFRYEPFARSKKSQDRRRAQRPSRLNLWHQIRFSR